jgi:NADPH2:quinone reductase
MKALILETYNARFVLKNTKTPVPGKGEVLVKIMAGGINPLDLKIKAGQAAHAKVVLPAVLGIDMAGVVERVGEGVTGFKEGDEVYGMTGGIGGVQGALAQYAAVDSRLLAKKPANLSMREAAAIPLSFITAWEGLVDRAIVGEGKTVLVHGGSGGVGHIAVQLAIARGARVYATVRTGKKELMASYGATAIDFTVSTVEEYLKEHTKGEGFDIVFDTMGGTMLDASFRAVKNYYGHVVSILGWGTHNLAPLSFKGATYSGVFTLLPLLTGKGRVHHGEIMKEASTIIEAGKLTPLMDPTRYTMETADQAFAAMENRTVQGKVVIEIDL